MEHAMSRHLALSTIVVVAILGACEQPSVDTVDLEAEGQALMQLSREWSDLVATGDMEAIMAGWADDAVMMPPGIPPLEGKAAIRSYVEGAAEIPGFAISWEPLAVQVAASGDMAYMIERNVITVHDPEGNPVRTHGKVITVWRKDVDGNWRNVVDMWNEMPPPGG
jgi:uncharacterized protein (TIGR02246 family)